MQQDIAKVRVFRSAIYCNIRKRCFVLGKSNWYIHKSAVFCLQVREVLLVQDTLMNMGTDSARDDFLNGKNGAVKLSEEELKYLDSFYNELTMKHQREDGEPTFLQQVQKVAEHYVALVEGKQREVIGTTYSKLKDIITSIIHCGYFDQVHESEAAPVEEVCVS